MWIEIYTGTPGNLWVMVTPLAGVWIEMLMPSALDAEMTVTPLAGVWIEISKEIRKLRNIAGHSPRGSVD